MKRIINKIEQLQELLLKSFNDSQVLGKIYKDDNEFLIDLGYIYKSPRERKNFDFKNIDNIDFSLWQPSEDILKKGAKFKKKYPDPRYNINLCQKLEAIEPGFLKERDACLSELELKFTQTAYDIIDMINILEEAKQDLIKEDHAQGFLKFLDVKDDHKEILKKIKSLSNIRQAVIANKKGKTKTDPNEVCKFIQKKLEEYPLSRADDEARLKKGSPRSAWGLAAKHYKVSLKTVKNYWKYKDIK